MSCTSPVLEVAGRRFPFGGRCSLYENAWKPKARTAAGRPDPAEKRAGLLFGHSKDGLAGGGRRIGIPRALTTHSLLPALRDVFFRAWAWTWCCPEWTRRAN